MHEFNFKEKKVGKQYSVDWMEDKKLTEKVVKNNERFPIYESKDYVSYLGVRLPKAEKSDSPYVPKKEKYADYINDKYALQLQKKIAIAWALGQPILIEGGTSIGKTTAVKKMASDLGYEVYYINLNGATEVEDLMGRYVPNPDKKTDDDPDFVFADGQVTKGLRQEDGKIKVIILDELNFADANIIGRLHEVLDALERNSSVVLSEDRGEEVQVDKNKTKIIALMNPPSAEYQDREALDVAQLRRWVYHKEVDTLPKESVGFAITQLFGLDSEVGKILDSEFLFNSDSALTIEEIAHIPGLKELLDKYLEFHLAVKQLLEMRQLAADQVQPFIFDDREEPRRVRDFIAHFYDGDINKTMQEALRYYYLNKLESKEDRAKMEELILKVKVDVPKENRRRSLKNKRDMLDLQKLFEIGENLKEKEVNKTELDNLEFLEDQLVNIDQIDKDLVLDFFVATNQMQSSKAMQLRKQLIDFSIQENLFTNSEELHQVLLYSLLGVDNEIAMQIRKKIFKIAEKNKNQDLLSSMLVSLANCNSEESFALRSEIIDKLNIDEEGKRYIALSLMGVEGELADEFRYKYLEDNNILTLLSLAGVNKEEKFQLLDQGQLTKKSDIGKLLLAFMGDSNPKVEQLRELAFQLAKKDLSILDNILESLVAVESEDSLSLRKQIKEFADSLQPTDRDLIYEKLALSLAGVSGKEAMSFRMELLNSGLLDFDVLAKSLVGLSLEEKNEFLNKLYELGLDNSDLSHFSTGNMILDFIAINYAK